MCEEGLSAITEDGKKILKTVPFTGPRRAIANSLFASLSEQVPNFSFVRADMSELVALRAKYKEKGLMFILLG